MHSQKHTICVTECMCEYKHSAGTVSVVRVISNKITNVEMIQVLDYVVIVKLVYITIHGCVFL